MLTIGNVRVDPPLVLAPMAGVTDRDFRLIIRRLGGVGVVTMEFISSKAIVGGHPKVRELMTFAEEERPLSIQIYGSDVDSMVEAARVVEGLGADVCDINMGCPANKVLKGCAGAALMGDPIWPTHGRAVRRVLTIPLTVKFRLGLNEERKSYLDLGRLCEANGVDAVAMHGRTAKQMFRGEAAWEGIARLKEAVSIPVLGNGDVRTADDALRMISETGCDGVMIGRGATKNPWPVFADRRPPARRRCPERPTVEDRRELILEHFRRLAEREPSSHALHKLRKFTVGTPTACRRGADCARRSTRCPTSRVSSPRSRPSSTTSRCTVRPDRPSGHGWRPSSAPGSKLAPRSTSEPRRVFARSRSVAGGRHEGRRGRCRGVGCRLAGEGSSGRIALPSVPACGTAFSWRASGPEPGKRRQPSPAQGGGRAATGCAWRRS